MNKALQEAASKLREIESVVVAIHVQPDGDAFGSLLAMSRFLKKIGKKVCATWGEEIKIPAQYRWLPGIDEIVDYNDCIGGDVLITLDCANEQRLGLMEKILPKFSAIINIDHHIDNSNFGTINVLDFNAGATAQIVYDLFKLMDAEIDTDMATCLYTGLVTDTGRFQYQNTNASVLRVAADLADLGVVPNQIFQRLYENVSFVALKLLAKVLDRAEMVDESKLIYSYILEEDLGETGVTIGETENFIDYLRSVREANVAAIFKQIPGNKWRISMRSKGAIDVGAICREGGGGGHRNAAGVTLEKSLEDAVDWISARIIAQTATSTAS